MFSSVSRRKELFFRCTLFQANSRGAIINRENDQKLVSTRLLSSKDNNTGGSSSTAANPNEYLHVGPSGDFWTGHNIFAAKHLQPDYVKSVKLDPTMCVETLLELLEENTPWAHEIYDTEALPTALLDILQSTSK